MAVTNKIDQQQLLPDNSWSQNKKCEQDKVSASAPSVTGGGKGERQSTRKVWLKMGSENGSHFTI